MISDWQKKSSEEKARYVANAKAKRHTKALSEGRVRLTSEQREKKRREYAKWYCAKVKASPELRAKKNANQRLWREKNIEKVRKSEIERWNKLKGIKRKYTREELDKRKIWSRASWNRKTAEQKSAFCAKIYEKCNEMYKAKARNRKALKRNAIGTHTAADIRGLYFMQKGKCAWCFEALGEQKPHVDHWIPLSKGGSNDKTNLKLLHPKCNMSKGAKLPSEFNIKIA